MSSKKKFVKKESSTPPAAPAPAAVPAPAPAPAAYRTPAYLTRVAPALMAVFFLGTCMTSGSSQKVVTLLVMAAAIFSCLFRLSYVRDRLSLPLAAISVWMLVNGVSTFYAVSGKFALREFLQLLAGFGCALLILAWSRREPGSGRAGASVLTGGTALASLFSIDMLSTHFLSGPLFWFLGLFSDDYLGISRTGVEVGVRMLSIYENPNVFAGIAGLGVLLSLELAVTAQGRRERCFHLTCLFLNALAFLLVFSMGASGMICLAFLALLLFERKGRKAPLLVLMIETLALALAGAFPIFLTAFGGWTGFQPIPLLCAVAGAALLCVLDCGLGQKISGGLARGGGKLLSLLIALVLVLIAAFGALAMSLTGPAVMEAGEKLRRAEYPSPGQYTLEVQSTGKVQVTIESQNQKETMMHTSTVLYSGDAQGAQFTVPEDSLVTYFNFRAGEALTLDAVTLTGAGETTQLKLHYKLLPGFIANRLQGLFANENAIQRVVFFADGMKLFRRGPVLGLGLGAFENSIQGVQSFFYETKYAHNHYVETLVSTGVVGLVVFVSMLGLCALAVWKNLRRKDEADPLAPALGAALVFMIGHGAVEVVFSSRYYLPMALGVLGLLCLCCGKELPLFAGKEELRSWCVAGLCALLTIYAILVCMNMQAISTAQKNRKGDPYRSLEAAARLDFFERNDYMLTYVYMAQGIDIDSNRNVYLKANEYAQRLAKEDSNTIPSYLAQYYFATNQPDQAVAMLKKYVDFVSANNETWQTAFAILEEWSGAYPENGQAAAELYAMLQRWNEENMGSITLSEANLQYIDSVLG